MSKPPARVPDPSKPIRVQAHEQFAQLIFKGASQTDAYKTVFPGSCKWKVTAVYGKASELAGKVAGRIEWLRARSADAAICSVVERKRILSEIARGNVADYAVAGKDGVWINYGPESKNPRAVSMIKSRTTEDGGVITELKVRDPESAIDVLNKMDGIYKDGAAAGVSAPVTVNIMMVGEADMARLLSPRDRRLLDDGPTAFEASEGPGESSLAFQGDAQEGD